MRYVLPFLLLAFPAFAQTGPAGSLSIGPHNHPTPGLVTKDDFDALKGLLDDHLATHEAPEEPEVPEKPEDPPVIPPGDEFAALCAGNGVIFCEGFDTDLSQANKNRCPNPEQPPELCPRIQSDMAYEGSALQFTTDGSLGSDMTGIVSFPFPGVSAGWVYAHMRIRFGDGIVAYNAADGFPGSKGDKFFIVAGDGETCNFPGGEVVVGDSRKRGFVSMNHSCSPGVRNEIPKNNFDLQPIDGIVGDCTYHSHKRDDISGCVQQKDDVWHNFEIAIYPAQNGDRARVKLWLDGVLVIDWESKPNPSSGFAWKGKGPYDEIYLTNYQTDHDRGADKGSGIYGDGLWRIWYDNLIVSTECITSC